MKKSFRSSILVLVFMIVMVGMITVQSCNKYENPKAVVTVLNGEDNNMPLEDVEVRVYSDPFDSTFLSHDAYIDPDSLIKEDIQISDKMGKTYHEFRFESILHVEAKLVVSKTVTLIGYGALVLKNDNTYNETVILKYKTISN